MWRRRSAFLAGAALVVLVIIGVVVAAGGSDDGGDDPAGTAAQEAPPQTQGARIANATIGAAIARPRGWTGRSAGRGIDLRDPSGATAVSVSAPRGTDRSAAVLEAALAGVRERYPGAEVARAPAKRVAGLPSVSAVAHAQDGRGAKLDVLLSAVQGKRRVWLVQVASGRDPRRGRGLVEAQVALGSLILRG